MHDKMTMIGKPENPDPNSRCALVALQKIVKVNIRPQQEAQAEIGGAIDKSSPSKIVTWVFIAFQGFCYVLCWGMKPHQVMKIG
jgi:hypothetical protein